MIWDLDAYYLRGHRLSHNTFSKLQIQGFNDFSSFKKSKPKDPKPTPLFDNAVELVKKKNRKDKKKRFWDQMWKHTKERKE